MTHGHLVLNFAGNFDYNTNKDDDRRATEGEEADSLCLGRYLHDSGSELRDSSDDAKEDRTDKSDSLKDLCDVVRSRLTGTDTEDRAAVLLEIVGYFDRAERDRNIEISECDNENEGKQRVEGVCGREEVDKLLPETRRVLRRRDEASGGGQ